MQSSLEQNFVSEEAKGKIGKLQTQLEAKQKKVKKAEDKLNELRLKVVEGEAAVKREESKDKERARRAEEEQRANELIAEANGQLAQLKVDLVPSLKSILAKKHPSFSVQETIKAVGQRCGSSEQTAFAIKELEKILTKCSI